MLRHCATIIPSYAYLDADIFYTLDIYSPSLCGLETPLEDAVAGFFERVVRTWRRTRRAAGAPAPLRCAAVAGARTLL